MPSTSLPSGQLAQSARKATAEADFLAGGGEMGARMRAFDWSRTSLGPRDRWPQLLKAIVRVMLDSRCAMWSCGGSGRREQTA